MRITLAYITVIVIWSTTPLAVKWSGDGPGFIFGAASRMVLGALCMLIFMLLRGQSIPFFSKAKRTYFAVATQIFAAMLAVYWGAQFIPSGWVAVIFGLSPFLSALFSAIWLNERSLTAIKLVSYFIGLAGLTIMFKSAISLNVNAVYGILGVLTAVSLQTATAVWIKRIGAKLPAITQVTGGLLFALPAYLFIWIIFDHALWPEQLSEINIASILYLGVFATTVGFVLYYFLLLHLSATSVGLIPMITPILALYIGHTINNEPFTLKIAIGSSLIILALLIHQFSDQLRFQYRKNS